MKPKYNIDRLKLIKKYHTLCAKLGMSDDEKRDMLRNNYQVISSTDLSTDDLRNICSVLNSQLNTPDAKIDKARKRVFGAIGGWLDVVSGKVDKKNKTEYNARITKIKAIACRQTGYTNFNDIPTERLANVSHLFTNKQKDNKKGNQVIDDELLKIASLN